MAGSLNRVLLIGRVGKDPTIRTLQNGDRVANFSLATSETWRDKSTGEKKEKTEWANVAIFNDGLVKVVESYVKKGSLIYVEGQLQTRKWTDNNGQERYTTEVVLRPFRGELTLLGDKREGGRSESGGGGDYGFSAESPHQDKRGNPAQSQTNEFDDGFGDGEIPFLTRASLF